MLVWAYLFKTTSDAIISGGWLSFPISNISVDYTRSILLLPITLESLPTIFIAEYHSSYHKSRTKDFPTISNNLWMINVFCMIHHILFVIFTWKDKSWKNPRNTFLCKMCFMFLDWKQSPQSSSSGLPVTLNNDLLTIAGQK